MARKSLVAEIVDAILDDIVSGVLGTDAGLPSEAEIAEIHDVSRLTAREATRTLAAQGVIRVETGRGSFVNPMSEWSSLSAVLRASAAHTSDAEVAVQLVELRQIFETGAAALAAARRSEADLVLLVDELAAMERAHHDGDVDAFVRADLAFHDVILKASGNVFLGAMFEPLTRILTQRRAETSRVHTIQAHAIAEHRGILEAMRTGDPAQATAAMDSHMRQTLDDLRHFVLGAGTTPE